MSGLGFVRIVCAAAIVMVVLGITAFALSTALPFDVVKPYLDSFARDGSVEILTREYYSGVRVRVAVLGVILLVLGALGFFFRKPLGRSVEGLVSTFWTDSRALLHGALSVRHHGIYFVAICSITLIALLIRAYFLDQPMRPDESFTFLRYATLPTYLIVADYNFVFPNNHVLHTLLVKLSCACFGDSPWAIRLPAFIAGVLVVPATYGVGYMLYGRKCALLGAGLAAASSVLVEYSTNARGYSLVTLAFMLGLMLAIFVKNHRNWVGWALLVAVSSLGFFAIPLMVYPFGIVIVWLLLAASTREARGEKLALIRNTLLCGTLVVICTGLLYSPILVAFAERERGMGVFGGPSPELNWNNFSMTWEQWNRSIPPPVMYLLVAGMFLGIVFHRRMSRHVPVALAVALWCGTLMCLHRIIPDPRQWQYLLPIYAILTASGLTYLYERSSFLEERRWLFAIGALVLSAALCLNLARTRTPTIDRTPVPFAKDLCRYLGERLLPGQKIVALSPSPNPIKYYFHRMGMDFDMVVTKETEDPWANSAGVSTVYVVVYTSLPEKQLPGSSLQSIDGFVGLSEVWDLDSADIVREYDSALVYALRRRLR